MLPPTEIPDWPFARTTIMDIAPVFRQLRARGPAYQVHTPGGELAWMVTSHRDVKALYADERLGWSHPDPEVSVTAAVGAPARAHQPAKPGQGRKGRAPLTHSFSYQRMRDLGTDIERMVDDLLSHIATLTPPVDLHQELSFPLPAWVICGLLGVPYSDRDRFRDWSIDAANWADRERSAAAMVEFTAYMEWLIERKRGEPGPNVISDLLVAESDGRLAAEEIARVAIGLLLAGHQTTVARLDLGTVLLLINPDERDLLAADPSLVEGAVEEILRMASPNGGGGLPRYAHADIQVGDQTIRSGDRVLLAASVANRDPAVFTDPDRFDIRRSPNPHLTFGHGPRFCCGAGVARMELVAVFGRMFQRIPTLRLAVPVAALEPRGEQVLGGLTALPVTW